MKEQKKPTPKTRVVKPKIVKETPEEELLKINELKEDTDNVLSEGLGDTIAKVTEFFGIKPCDKCIKRKEFLNRHIKYLEISRDIDESEVELMEKLNKNPGYIDSRDIEPLFKLYNELYNKRLVSCRCGGVISGIMRTINNSIKALKDEANT